MAHQLLASEERRGGLPHAEPLVDWSAEDAGREFVVATKGLTKRFAEGRLAVDRLDLHIRRGEVYGFLGPNGAGKTTTLRMLLGLIRPTAGTAFVLGQPPGAKTGLAQIGALVETPAFYPYLSGHDNLRVLALHGGIARPAIEEALAQVELSDRAGDAFKTYSLGMKQRLGVAAALMKNPALLILDEPTNGLDPAGMAEMRGLVRKLGQGSRTVLLSSHLMAEVEQICDRVGIIHHGRLVAERRVAELRGRDTLRVRATPLDVARRIVANFAGVSEVEEHDGALRIAVDPTAAADVNRALMTAGVAVSELVREQTSLESVFLALTNADGERHEG